MEMKIFNLRDYDFEVEFNSAEEVSEWLKELLSHQFHSFELESGIWLIGAHLVRIWIKEKELNGNQDNK